MPLPIVRQISNYGWTIRPLINQLGLKKWDSPRDAQRHIKDILKTQQQRVLQKSNIFLDNLCNLCIIYFFLLTRSASKKKYADCIKARIKFI